jgi:hypothetical protein
MCNSHYYFEEAGVILSNTGEPWRGKGDCLFRTAQFAMFEFDFRMLERCGDLLLWRRRWPEDLDHPDGLKAEHRKPYGFRSMTWDPYLMFYCASIVLEREQFLYSINPPWYVWRPTRAAWLKYVRSGKRFWKRLWEITETIAQWHNTPAYTWYLTAWMAYMADSSKIKKILGKKVPHWNYCIRQLIHHPLRDLDYRFITTYKPAKGFQWQKEKWSDRELLPEDQERYLDLDSLVYVQTRNDFMYKDKDGWELNSN